MKNVLMAAGGSIDTDLLADFLEKNKENIDCTVACDRGYEAFSAVGVKPDIVIGDLDSISDGLKKTLSEDRGAAGELIRLNPQKDDTDTEAAISLCAKRGAKRIYLFGATGKRIDHVLGNVELLAFARDRGCELFIIDKNNRIRLSESSIKILRNEQWGDFISLIPYSPVVKGLTLRGMKYELNDHTMQKGNTLGISNEITGDAADISFSSGSLIIIESSD